MVLLARALIEGRRDEATLVIAANIIAAADAAVAANAANNVPQQTD